MHDHFGWSWNPGDAGIGHYDVEVEFSIVNSHGDVVWRFDAMAMIIPPLSVKGSLEAVTATTPSDDDILKVYSGLFVALPKVVVKLIDEDLARYNRILCSA